MTSLLFLIRLCLDSFTFNILVDIVHQENAKHNERGSYPPQQGKTFSKQQQTKHRLYWRNIIITTIILDLSKIFKI